MKEGGAMPKESNGKARAVVGIDPDVEKSGFALLFPSTGDMELTTLDLFRLFMRVSQLSVKYDLTVYLEAGHTVKKTWQRRTVGTIKDVGRNNEIGSQIEKFLISQGIDHVLIKPKGYSSYDHALFCKITGWNVKARTNPETRVAGLLTYGRK